MEDTSKEVSSFSSSCKVTQLRVRKNLTILSHDGLCGSGCSSLETLKM